MSKNYVKSFSSSYLIIPFTSVYVNFDFNAAFNVYVK